MTAMGLRTASSSPTAYSHWIQHSICLLFFNRNECKSGFSVAQLIPVLAETMKGVRVAVTQPVRAFITVACRRRASYGSPHASRLLQNPF